MFPIIRNFISVARRFKLAAILNVLGLSVAFAAFIIIMIQLNYDFNFDKFHNDSDKIFRVENFFDKTEPSTLFARPFAELFIESSPHIIAGTILGNLNKNYFYHVETNGIRNYYKEYLMNVSQGFTDVFTFDFIDGNKDALKIPDNVIIPLSVSRKIFGNESAVGKQIWLGENINRTIGAVYRDFPPNTIINNFIYDLIPENENKDNWGNWNYEVYICVNQASNTNILFENFKQKIDFKPFFGKDFDWEEYGFNIRFTSLPDIHFLTDVLWDATPKASKQTLLILFAIAIVIVAIAGINFTNFTIALSPMRIRSINAQKVFGAHQTTLRLSIVFEAVFLCLSAFIIAIYLVALFNDSPLSNLVDANLSVSANFAIYAIAFFIALATGLFAGLYPAFYMTSFSPAFALKGSFGLSPKGKKLRNTLISIQFISSIALIIGSLFMYLQNRYLQNSPLGYEKDLLLTVDIEQIIEKSDALADKLKSYPQIKDVTYGRFLLSNSDRYMTWECHYKGEQMPIQIFPVHYTFPEVMEINIYEGRYFRHEDAGKQFGSFILNETAQKKYNLKLNTLFENCNNSEIVGFMKDIKFASFRTAVEPMAFMVLGDDYWKSLSGYAYIKVKAGANMRETTLFINNTLAEFDADYPFEVRFFDDVLQKLYKKEISLTKLISLFSFIAIFISIVGVFGLVVFESECRRKEIGIRKVYGATAGGIVLMFNKVYLKILLICFVIAAPLAWYAVNEWLQNFAYKTPMYLWVYLLALLAVAIITSATVTFQNWRVANENPVKSIN